MNGTMIQYFHWYTPEGSLWNQLKEQAGFLKDLGITSVWLPPASKASTGGLSVGYDAYDLYDLGEFDQQGSIPTRYGTKEELLAAVKALKEKDLKIIVDIVLNHKAGGDEKEKVMAIRVDEENRNEIVSEPFEMEAYTKFTFPGRNGKYSEFIWDHQCFTGVDHNAKNGDHGIFSFLSEYGDGWDEVIDDEKGNYDFLMYADIEFRNPAVREELFRWGIWLHETLGFDGVRLDAVKHISPHFMKEWLLRLREHTGKDIFAVGEYWAPGLLHLLQRYLDTTDGEMSLFDSSLHHNFHRASTLGNGFDMRKIFDGTLVQVSPHLAVTVTDNHDTQPMQALEAPVEHWFKPLAYALILLRAEGYPCVFYPDLYGASYWDKGSDGNDYEIFLNKVEDIEKLLQLRRDHAYGEQRDYFDHPNCLGWVRTGDEEHPACAVVLSNGDSGFKPMEIGTLYAGVTFVDALGKVDERIAIRDDGWADFKCAPGSVSVWIPESSL